MKKIFFAPKIDNYNDPYNHPLLDEVAFIPPTKFLEYFSNNHINHTYWKCPAWKKYYQNTFVFFSQIDINIKYDIKSGIIDKESFKYCSFDEGADLTHEVFIGELPPEHPPKIPYNGVAIGQIIQHYVFWPEKKDTDIWVEILPIPTMLTTHNVELIGGEFPASRWFRPCLFAYKFYSNETIIKRGEPLGLIKFKNLDNYLEDINIERSVIPDIISKKAFNHGFLKIFLPNQSWNLIKNKPITKTLKQKIKNIFK